jgi:hypothetical protein
VAAQAAFVEVITVTMCEFAEKYGLYRADVNTAVRLARVDPLPDKKLGANGQYVNTYAEREIARAVIAFYKGKRDHYVAKAQSWTDKANAVAARYKEGRA